MKLADQVEALIQTVLESAKYRAISPDVIRIVGVRELGARRNLKEAIKATKNKLHQIAGAYLDSRPEYQNWLTQLHEITQSGDQQQLRPVLLKMMHAHASTRERLHLLDTFYTTTLAAIRPIHSVLDVACGLNPLAWPWMSLDPDSVYYACDIYTDMVAFLNQYFAIAGIRGQAYACDLISNPPQQPVDLALALKVLPPLEQVDKTAGLHLLRTLQANHVLVSFPAQTLGGRGKGMGQYYEQHFHALTKNEGWQIERFAFATELAFLIHKTQ